MKITRLCNYCNTEKDISEFYNEKGFKCKNCVNEHKRIHAHEKLIAERAVTKTNKKLDKLAKEAVDRHMTYGQLQALETMGRK